MTTFLDAMNMIFLVIFVGEMILKLLGLGRRQYFNDNWNCFDAFLVFGSLVDTSLDYALGGSNSAGAMLQIVRSLRMFRVLRMFRLVRGAKSLRVISRTLIYTLPSLANISILLGLFLFIFATMGKEVRCRGSTPRALWVTIAQPCKLRSN